jgi:hypothetical protein
MTRDDIIRLAREVDAEISAFIDYHYDQEMVVFSKGQLERFAALVAAAEREACAEACKNPCVNDEDIHHWPTSEMCAAAIRARGEK